MKKIVGLYKRTSTDRQDKGFQAQEQALLNYCQTHNIENYAFYEDFGVSGAKSARRRPGLKKLLQDAQDGLISKVIVYSLSRFGRSTVQLLNDIELLNKLGVEFHSLSESLDTKTASGRVFLTILSALAAYEREVASERIKNGLKNARKKGKRIGRKPQPRNTQAMVSLRSAGFNIREIASRLELSRSMVQRELYKLPTISDPKTLPKIVNS